MRPRIYVAGPYTKGDVCVNVRCAIEEADWLFSLGVAPYIPHLMHFWHLVIPRHYEDWMNLDLDWLPQCHALRRLPGDSSGADREVKKACELQMPVLYSRDEVLAWLKEWNHGR